MLSSKRAKALIGVVCSQLQSWWGGNASIVIDRYDPTSFRLCINSKANGDTFDAADTIGRRIAGSQISECFCTGVEYRELHDGLFRVEATFEYGHFELSNAAKEFEETLSKILSKYQQGPAELVCIERSPGGTRHLLSLNRVTPGTRVLDIQKTIIATLGREDAFSETQFAGFRADTVSFITNTQWVVVNDQLEPVAANPDRLPLDEAYLQMAEIWGRRSKSNRAQVGALIVKGTQIISDGYNGLPNGHEPDVCEIRNPDGTLSTKPDVLHAESNAIAKLARHGGTGSDSATIYVNLSPCEQCAKLIVQAGIKRVVYRDAYRSQAGVEKLVNAGVEVTHIPKEAK